MTMTKKRQYVKPHFEIVPLPREFMDSDEIIMSNWDPAGEKGPELPVNPDPPGPGKITGAKGQTWGCHWDLWEDDEELQGTIGGSSAY